MKIIDGKKIAEDLNKKLKIKIAALKNKIELSLVVILVGSNPASKIYVKNKEKKALEIGIGSQVINLDEDVKEQELLNMVEVFNKDENVDGILVQLPLPKHISSKKIIDKIDPIKDVDGFSAINIGLLALGRPNVIPCTPLGCFKLIETVQNLEGKDAIIIGRSDIVGKPLSYLLTNNNATVTIAHSKTKDLEKKTFNHDIVIAAVGVPKLVKNNWVRDNTVIIDVGINTIFGKDGKRKLVGDVDFETFFGKPVNITPVPGGVGPMTIHCLLSNTLDLAIKRRSKFLS